MSDSIITVENLGKKYVLGHQKAERYTALRDVMAEQARSLSRRVRRPFGNGSAEQSGNSEEFWALKDVSFEVKQGDRVGIIGRNGAGKSTLLKIFSRITEPTTGRVRIKGRVASLLEVGTGFHPELTGRENIYLNGAILGMSKAEIKRKFDEIVDFAEVEKFLDTPVKRYSSGMYVRLAFAVAAHLEPEILIVDEVLAVGDALFQKKCLGRMSEVAEQGRTVLFVSHNMNAITSLTNRSILLSDGQCILNDHTPAVIAEYLKQSEVKSATYTAPSSAIQPKVTRVELKTSASNNVQVHGKPMQVDIEIVTPEPINGCRLALRTLDQLRNRVSYVWAYDCEQPMCRTAGKHYLRFCLPKVHLYQGMYSLEINFAEYTGGRFFEAIDGICPFEVVMHDRHRDGGYGPNEGAYVEDWQWCIERVEP